MHHLRENHCSFVHREGLEGLSNAEKAMRCSANGLRCRAHLWGLGSKPMVINHDQNWPSKTNANPA